MTGFVERIARVAEWYESGPGYPRDLEEGRQRIASDLRTLLTELRDLHVEMSANETAWLIEFPEAGDRYEGGKRVGPARPVQYYCGLRQPDGHWLTRTQEPNEAIRFARKVDAHSFIGAALGPDWRAIAVEHQWIDRRATEEIRELVK